MIYAPFGYGVRATRDSALRADAIGFADAAVAVGGVCGGGGGGRVGGGLYAFAKGSVFPTYISIPKSVDGLLMVLLGGLGR